MKRIKVTPERAVELVDIIYRWSQLLNNIKPDDYHAGYSAAQKSLEEIIEYKISRSGKDDVIEYDVPDNRVEDAFKELNIDTPYDDTAILIFHHDGKWIVQKLLKASIIPRLKFPPQPL